MPARQRLLQVIDQPFQLNLLGIDSCPMEGFMPEEYDKILDLEKEGLTTAVLLPLGYRAETDRYAGLPKVRFETQHVVEYR